MGAEQKDRISRYHWLLFTVCFLGTAFAGVISTLMFVYLPVVTAELIGNADEDLNIISAYINSIFVFGAAIGGIVSGVISDRAGRKIAVIFSIACYSVFTILTGVMSNWWAVVICRGLSGFGFGAVLVSTTTLMIEEWPERSRTIFIGILSIAIPVGIFSAGVIDVLVSDWRQAFLVGIIPLIIAIASVWLLHESQRWKQDRLKQSGWPGDNADVPLSEYRGGLIVGSLIFGTMLIGLWAVFSWLPTWIEELVAGGDSQTERGISMMMLGAGGLTGGFISGWLMNIIGIRRSLLLCFAVCAVFSFILFKTNAVFSPVIYAEIIIISLAFGASQGVLSLYIPLLFPVAVRGRATGLCFNTGRLFTGTAVLFVGVLVTVLGGYGNSLFVFSLVFIAGFLATLMSVQPMRVDLETKTESKVDIKKFHAPSTEKNEQ